MHVVDVVVLNDRGPGYIDAVLDVVDIVADKRTLAIDSDIAGGVAEAVDFAILDNRPRRSRGYVHHEIGAGGYLTILQRHIRGFDRNRSCNVEAGDYGTGFRNYEVP